MWIYFGFKEISYQLWGGQRYDTLEIIQEILNSSMVRYNQHSLALSNSALELEWLHNDHFFCSQDSDLKDEVQKEVCTSS